MECRLMWPRGLRSRQEDGWEALGPAGHGTGGLRTVRSVKKGAVSQLRLLRGFLGLAGGSVWLTWHLGFLELAQHALVGGLPDAA
jgi:hypothetical protein